MSKPIFETPDIRKKSASEDASAQRCAHDGCTAEGLYRAPRSRDDLRDYIWFCLDHIRAFNKQWNYFEGLDEDSMEEAIRRSTTWERPSWKFGTAGKQGFDADFDDPLGVFSGSKKAAGGASSQQDNTPSLHPDERKAFDIFELTPCADSQTVKKRYKELAKIHHPDANGGSRESEDRLKIINWAYSVLKHRIASSAT